jgi:hypothetical protein
MIVRSMTADVEGPDSASGEAAEPVRLAQLNFHVEPKQAADFREAVGQLSQKLGRRAGFFEVGRELIALFLEDAAVANKLHQRLVDRTPEELAHRKDVAFRSLRGRNPARYPRPPGDGSIGRSL